MPGKLEQLEQERQRLCEQIVEEVRPFATISPNFWPETTRRVLRLLALLKKVEDEIAKEQGKPIAKEPTTEDADPFKAF